MQNPPNRPSHPPPDSPLTRRALVGVVAASFGLAAIPLAAVGQLWRRDDARPAIAFLGSGDHLSVYLSDGPVRALIVTGTNGRDLLSALDSVRHPTSRRMDVVVLAGSSRDQPAHTTAIESIDARQYIALESDIEPDTLRSARARFISADTTIRLGSRLEMDFQWGITDGTGRVWRCFIRFGPATIMVTSNESASMMSDPDRPLTAVVYVDDLPQISRQMPGQLIVVPTAVDRISVLRRCGVPEVTDRRLLRVAPGSAVRLALTPSGIHVPESTPKLCEG